MKNSSPNMRSEIEAERQLGSADPFYFLPKNGQAASLIRSIDWRKSPIGAVGKWPQSLKTSISNMLACRFPMYIVWGKDFTQFYNDAYSPILGPFRHPHAMGACAKTTWSEVWHSIGPMFEEVLQSGGSTGFDNYPFQVTRSGFPEDCFFTFSYSAIRDDSGIPFGVLNTVFETTVQVKVEREAEIAKQKEAKYLQTLLERQSELNVSQHETELARQEIFDFVMQTPSPMVVLLGSEHRFAVANPAYETMVSRKVVGKTVLEAFSREEVGDFINLLDDVYKTGKPYIGKELPFSVRNAGGVVNELFINIGYHPFIDRAGVVKGVIAFVHDVTEQVEARRKLVLERELRERFVSTLTHDLRTPLTAAKLSAELVERSPDTSAINRKLVYRIGTKPQ